MPDHLITALFAIGYGFHAVGHASPTLQAYFTIATIANLMTLFPIL